MSVCKVFTRIVLAVVIAAFATANWAADLKETEAKTCTGRVE